ncbi:MAG: EamA family transporter RarD [Actinomycetota bacterium]|nr:EamA family transporter RarD [Acidimicrobiales bacterium]MEC8982796.1 EamA family transporter RarD [Actinomycetota bacterium]MEC9426413.1 EamA family transporter RarD [Actinomycetota bacterium]MEC9449488.1 EamA family transporter RarD [Actinomycetota bacterium]MED5167011.1 EamA family transporter RarD [Actinomycetota bacterium]
MEVFGSGGETSEMRRGLLYILCAQVMWGVSPAFWRGVVDVPALDVLAHRAFWTFIVLLVVHLVRRSWTDVREAARMPSILGLEVLAGVLIGSNWLAWIWAVNNDMVLEGSLGYFITPLVSVLLGVLVVGERLRRAQWLAVALGAASVVWLTVDVGRLPWVSLFLAGTFGIYGLIKKKVDRPPIDMLAIELTVMLPVTLGYLAYRTSSGHDVLFSGTLTEVVVLLASGVFTAAPLLFFAGGVRRAPLSVVGVLQYLSPSINFLLGVVAFGEPFGSGRLVGFVLVWTGLAVFTADGIQSVRPPRRR